MIGLLQSDYPFLLSFSGQFRVGVITFDMFLNISYVDLVPHIKELAELIANELEVASDQVE